MKLLHLPQPPTKRRVLELLLDGWAGVALHVVTGVDAQTLALPFLRVILYFGRKPSGYLRVHEFEHVHDADRLTWIGLALGYVWEFARRGYRGSSYEKRAYAIQRAAMTNGLPDWAKETT